MEIRKEDSQRIAYVCDEEWLQHFHKLFSNYVSTLEFTVITSDKETIKYDNLRQVINFTNTKQAQITSIVFDTPLYIRTQEDHMIGDKIVSFPSWTTLTPQVYLRMSTGRNSFANISYYVSGDDQAKVTFLFGEIERLIASLKLSSVYSWIAFADFGALASFGFMFYALALFAPILLDESRRISFFNAFNATPFMTLCLSSIPYTILYLFIINVVFGIFVNRIKNHLFPAVTFAIGAGIKRHKRIQTWRDSVVISGIILPIIVGILFFLASQ